MGTFYKILRVISIIIISIYVLFPLSSLLITTSIRLSNTHNTSYMNNSNGIEKILKLGNASNTDNAKNLKNNETKENEANNHINASILYSLTSASPFIRDKSNNSMDSTFFPTLEFAKKVFKKQKLGEELDIEPVSVLYYDKSKPTVPSRIPKTRKHAKKKNPSYEQVYDKSVINFQLLGPLRVTVQMCVRKNGDMEIFKNKNRGSVLGYSKPPCFKSINKNFADIISVPQLPKVKNSQDIEYSQYVFKFNSGYSFNLYLQNKYEYTDMPFEYLDNDLYYLGKFFMENVPVTNDLEHNFFRCKDLLTVIENCISYVKVGDVTQTRLFDIYNQMKLYSKDYSQMCVASWNFYEVSNDSKYIHIDNFIALLNLEFK